MGGEGGRLDHFQLNTRCKGCYFVFRIVLGHDRFQVHVVVNALMTVGF
jgi:hypothetical protein